MVHIFVAFSEYLIFTCIKCLDKFLCIDCFVFVLQAWILYAYSLFIQGNVLKHVTFCFSGLADICLRGFLWMPNKCEADWRRWQFGLLFTGKVWVFLKGHKIWKKSSSYFWQERRFSVRATAFLSKSWRRFFKTNVVMSYYTNFKVHNAGCHL